MFEQALAIDPNDAGALAGEATTYLFDKAFGWAEPDVDYNAKVIGLADRSIAIAPEEARPYSTKSIYLSSGNHPAEGLRAADAGLAVNPNDALLHAARGLAQDYLGHFDQGISEVRQAMRLSPRDPNTGAWHNFASFGELGLGHFDAAIEKSNKAIDAGYRVFPPYVQLAVAYALEGKLPEAKAALAEARRVNPKLTVKLMRENSIQIFRGCPKACAKLGFRRSDRDPGRRHLNAGHLRLQRLKPRTSMCPLYVDSSRPECANSGPCQTAGERLKSTRSRIVHWRALHPLVRFFFGKGQGGSRRVFHASLASGGSSPWARRARSLRFSVSDIVGYSRLAGADEGRILARLRALRSDLIDPTIALHHGRVVKRTGDGSMIEFRSVVDAVRCAIEVQNGMVERNAGLPPERRIEFRIGIRLGDVVEEADGDLMGDGVNTAARLEGIAEPERSVCQGTLPPRANTRRAGLESVQSAP